MEGVDEDVGRMVVESVGEDPDVKVGRLVCKKAAWVVYWVGRSVKISNSQMLKGKFSIPCTITNLEEINDYIDTAFTVMSFLE